MVKIVICLIVAAAFGIFGWLVAMRDSEQPTMGDIIVTLKGAPLILMIVIMLCVLAI